MNELDLLLEPPIHVVEYLDKSRWPPHATKVALSRPDVRAWLVDREWYMGFTQWRCTVDTALKALGYRATWGHLVTGTGFLPATGRCLTAIDRI